jgi:hypothetical protein
MTLTPTHAYQGNVNVPLLIKNIGVQGLISPRRGRFGPIQR